MKILNFVSIFIIFWATLIPSFFWDILLGKTATRLASMPGCARLCCPEPPPKIQKNMCPPVPASAHLCPPLPACAPPEVNWHPQRKTIFTICAIAGGLACGCRREGQGQGGGNSPEGDGLSWKHIGISCDLHITPPIKKKMPLGGAALIGRPEGVE